jgi:hypothetical protein
MEPHNTAELHEKIRSLVRHREGDPLSRFLRDQLEIVLEALEGWESLSSLLASQPE